MESVSSADTRLMKFHLWRLSQRQRTLSTENGFKVIGKLTLMKLNENSISKRIANVRFHNMPYGHMDI